MIAIRLASGLGLLALGLGCSSGYDAASPPAPAKPAQPSQVASQPGAPSAQGGTSGATAPKPAQPNHSSPMARPAPTAVSAAPSGPTPTISIRLSAGVALPQTLPDGTAMGFSVDYQVAQGEAKPGERYYWVIERAQGPPARQAVALQARGTLQGFFTDFRPEHGPFQTHLEDSRGNRISGSEPLR